MNDVVVNAPAIRELLYGILTGAVEGMGDLQVNQQLDLAISKAVQKEGVNIIQVQSVQMYNVISSVTKALKMLDMAGPVQLPEPKKELETENDLAIQIEDHLASMTGLDDFMHLIARRYVEAALKKFPTVKEAQTALDISYQRLLKLRKKYGL